jgi:hypothetical protein
MAIEVVTDCTGIKHDAIRNAFLKKYSSTGVEINVHKGESFQTPLTLDDFHLTARKRFQWIKKTYENPDVFIATIQKGYYCLHGMWYLSACIGIAYPLLSLLTVMASSVPVGTRCSEEKSLNLSKNMSDILKEKHPEWDMKNESVYTLLTGEDETAWLEQPLRHCLKTVSYFG